MLKAARIALVAGVFALAVAGAGPAAAKGTDVIRQGSCSDSSNWKLKVSPDDNRIEVEFEVDSNVNGQTWRVKVFQNGSRVFRGTRVTSAPSGSFTVRKRVTDTSGVDRFRARASNPVTSETCLGTAAV